MTSCTPSPTSVAEVVTDGSPRELSHDTLGDVLGRVARLPEQEIDGLLDGDVGRWVTDRCGEVSCEGEGHHLGHVRR